MKMFLWITALLLTSLVLFMAWASHPWSLEQKTETPEVVVIEPEGMVDTEEDLSVVKIMTWNLGFLHGEGSEGPGYQFKNRGYYKERLETLVSQIKQWQPDIICLQEVDFESHRTSGINQARYLALKASYPYVAEAVSWDANYIPFPYWPLTNNFGRMRSGGAILSKYPILSHEVTLLQKPKSQPWWYNLFYLHRYTQKITVELGSKKFQLINLHLEAFDKKDRQDQIQALAQAALTSKIDFIAGDFNMVPTSATKKSKFFNRDDYENDSSYEFMQKSGMLEVVPEIIYAENEAQYFTFPAWRPDRRLDYIYYRAGLKMMRAEVLPSALSDHLPLRATFQIDSPRFNPYSQ